MLRSAVCKYEDFGSRWYRTREADLGIRGIFAGHSAGQVDFVNRKFWEWIYIAEALDERGMLGAGKRGLGFAVGTEPLAAYFAARGCEILATDLAPELSDAGWIETGQHAAAKSNLYQPSLVSREAFDRLVTFRPADMRTLDGVGGKYDFVWSSCALEHLGSLEAGMAFVERSSALLAPGGVAVHTTEFNVRSDDDTIATGPSVIYRRRDIEALRKRLAASGFRLHAPDYDPGSHPCDIDYDVEPYMTSGKPHLKLELGGHICTSMLLIVERPSGSILDRFKDMLRRR